MRILVLKYVVLRYTHFQIFLPNIFFFSFRTNIYETLVLWVYCLLKMICSLCTWSLSFHRVNMTTCRMKKSTVTYVFNLFFWTTNFQTINIIKLEKKINDGSNRLLSFFVFLLLLKAIYLIPVESTEYSRETIIVYT